VTGERAVDGALLANDPHLPTQLPSPWYELEMQAPGYHAAGAALPGVPWILIGHNAALAWGITAAAADTQDLFLERTSADGRTVLRPDGRMEPIQVRTEWIPVAGRDQAVRLDVRSTRHGVLIDELVAGPDANPAGLTTVQRPERLALRTTLSDPDRSMEALYRLNQAQTIEEARSAVLGLQQVSLNFLFAHRNGRIAWQVSGRLPNRRRGSGTFPVPAWEVGYGWDGFRPLAENPGLSDPPSQRLLNANNAMPESQASPPISHSWLAPFRAWRIAALLDGQAVLGAAAMAQMQSDRISEEAQLYLAALRRQMPSLEAHAPEAAAVARSRLLAWDGRFDRLSEPAAFFVMLRPALYRALYGDELGTDLDALMSLEQVTYGPLAETMRDDRSSFWDDVRTEGEREGPAAIWARALLDAERSLQEAGVDHARPTLAELRLLTFEHALGGQPLLGWLFNVGPLGHGGDNGTLDVAIAPQTQPREIRNVPSLRVVFTPSDWSRTRGTLPLGQSGHRFSRFRADQLDDWLDGRLHPWPWDGPAGQSLGTLTLRPPPR
jgi:acyl-homoserine lactone acylase PvdQ